MSSQWRGVLACALALAVAGPAGARGSAGAPAGAEAVEGVSLLKWTGEQLGSALAGEVGGLVFSGLLSGIGLGGGDPNAPIMAELRVVEAKLDQISNQIDTVSNQVAAGLEDLGCHAQANAYNSAIDSTRGDRATIQQHAEWLHRISQNESAGDVAEAQADIRGAFDHSPDLVEIHHRIADFAPRAVQAYNDQMRACGFFIDTRRLARLKTQFAWVASLQASACQMVLNHYYDRATQAGVTPKDDGDFRAAATDCQRYTGQGLQAMGITSSLPDDGTVYELAASDVGTNLLWKWAGVPPGRESCYGDFNNNGQPFHKAIPDQVARADCKGFQVPGNVCTPIPPGAGGGKDCPPVTIQLWIQVFGDATSSLQRLGGDWLVPLERDVRRFIGSCKGLGDLGTKRCLAGKGWTDASGTVIGGEGGGFYLWALPDKFNSVRSRTTNANFLWVVDNGAGSAHPTGDPTYGAGLLVVRSSAASDRFILDPASP